MTRRPSTPCEPHDRPFCYECKGDEDLEYRGVSASAPTHVQGEDGAVKEFAPEIKVNREYL